MKRTYIILWSALLFVTFCFTLKVIAGDKKEEMKEKTVSQLIEELRSGKRKVKIAALKELERRGDKEALFPVIEILRGKDLVMKWRACEVLKKIKDKRSVPALIERLKDRSENWSVQVEAGEALAEIGDERAFQPLVEIFLYECEIERKDVNPPPMRSVGTADEAVEIEMRANIRKFIRGIKNAQLKEKYINKIYQYMKGEKKLTKLKYYFATTLGNLGDRRSVPVLIDYLERGENGLFRSRAASLLGDLGDKRAIPALKKALKDDYICMGKGRKNYGYTVRYEAWRSLTKLGVKVEKKGDEYEVVE